VKFRAKLRCDALLRGAPKRVFISNQILAEGNRMQFRATEVLSAENDSVLKESFAELRGAS